MADETDESRGADESGAVPEEKAVGGVKASSKGDDADDTLSVDAANTAGRAVEETARVEAVAEADNGVEADLPSASAVAAEASREAVYETAQSVDPSGPPRPAAGSTGATPRYAGAGRVETGDLDRPGLDLLYDVELDATLQFGSKEMLLRDVLELGPGDVVELDRHIAQPVDLVVGDRIVARGEVVVASGNFALRVTEVATPQMRLESIRCLF
jgi:flagellar motor switch protein FliN/FliY